MKRTFLPFELARFRLPIAMSTENDECQQLISPVVRELAFELLDFELAFFGFCREKADKRTRLKYITSTHAQPARGRPQWAPRNTVDAG